MQISPTVWPFSSVFPLPNFYILPNPKPLYKNATEMAILYVDKTKLKGKRWKSLKNWRYS